MATPETIDVQVLLQRVADELSQLKLITDRLQAATYDIAKAAGPEHLRAFQDIDRLHQSLEHLADFVGSLATALPQVFQIDAKQYAGSITLTRLCNALIGTQIITLSDGDDGELELLRPFDGSQSAEFVPKVG